MKKLKGIFLIDDDDTNNFLNRRLLQRMQVSDRIKEFRNGKQAFDFLTLLSQEPDTPATADHFKPSLIFLDINMPVMDGFEFLHLFEQLPAAFRENVVLTLLTTSGHGQDTRRAAAGKIAYLLKPLTPAKVQHLVDEYFPEGEEE